MTLIARDERSLGIRVKPHDIEVPRDDPFKHDALDRQKSVEIVARLVRSMEGPAVFRLEADWGNGKTTFLRMLRQFLENKGVPVVSFNAWESDHISDPFTAIATELTDSLGERAQNSDDRSKEKIRAGLERAQAVMVTRAPALLRSLVGQVPVAGKALGEMVDGFADNQVEDRVSAYRDARSSMAEFKNALEDMARTRDHHGLGEIDTLVSILKSFLGEPVVSLRTAARAVHHLGMVYAALEDHRLVLGTITAILVILRTLDQGLYYRFIDGRASDAEVVAGIAERLGDEACARHKHDFAVFEAWIIASQRERDGGYDGMFDNRVETPLIRHYKKIVAEEGVQPDQAIALKQA